MVGGEERVFSTGWVDPNLKARLWLRKQAQESKRTQRGLTGLWRVRWELERVRE